MIEINKKIINDAVFDSAPQKTSYASCRGQLHCSLCKTVQSTAKSNPIKEFYNLHPGVKSPDYNNGVVFIMDSYPNENGKIIKDRDVAALFSKLLTTTNVKNYYVISSVKCEIEALGMKATAKVRDNCHEITKRIILEKLKPKIVVTDSVPIFNQVTGLKFASSGRISNTIGWSSELNCYVMILLSFKLLISDMYASENKVLESTRLANIRKGFELVNEVLSGNYKEHFVRFDRTKLNYRKLTLESSEQEIDEYFKYLMSCKQAAVDIETTGLSVFTDKITMMAITTAVGEAMNFSKEFMDKHRNRFEQFFESEIEKIWANGAFDVAFLMYDGYKFKGPMTDIQVYNYLNRNGLDYDSSLTGVKLSSKIKGKGTNTLKYLSWIYTDLGGYEQSVKKQGGIIEIQKKEGKDKKQKTKRDINLELFQEVIKNNIAPGSKLTVDDARGIKFEGEVTDNSLTDTEEYNCTDTDATFRIKLELVDSSEERVKKVYTMLLGPLIFEVLTQIYLKGIRIDLPYLEELILKYRGSEDGSTIGLIDQVKDAFAEELKKEIIASGNVSYSDLVKLYPEESSFDKDNEAKDIGKLLDVIKININSSKQILEIYKKLGYLDKSADSVDGDVLDYLGKKGIKSAEQKAKYQPLNKIFTSYILPFKRKNIDGFIHSSFQTNLVTGRLCVAGDTIINTDKGDFQIKDINVDKDLKVLTHLGNLKKITNKFYKGKEQMYEVMLENGSKIKCTAGHRFLAGKEWKHLSDLTEGDYLCVPDTTWSKNFTTEDSIKKIVPCGVLDVWDIEVEDDHSYAAQGFLSHNSSSEPNMQQIPADNEIRNICIARDGYSIVDMDYSAAELRVLAEVADQEDWIEGFKNEFDPHWAMAKKMFRFPMADRPKADKAAAVLEVANWMESFGWLKNGFDINDPAIIELVKLKIAELDKKRNQAKTLNFSIVYGSGAKGIAEGLNSDFAFVSKDVQKRYIQEAKELIDSWFKAAPKIQQWLKSMHEFAYKHNYIETLLGRRRYLVFAGSNYNQFSASSKREAGNTPIQSLASDMCAYAAVLIQRHINQFPEDDCRIINIVHDNIMLEVPDHKKESYAAAAVDIMQNQANMLKRVPMKVDYQITKKWVK